MKELEIPVITIGGTNGKGETAHNLKHLFSLDGKKVGLFTSPHVLSIRERFIFGEEISYEELSSELEIRYFELKGKSVSYYEFLFYVFCHLAIKKNVDVIILEVGLGGRLDAVNYLEPDLTAITSISRDHQQFLGNTFREILKEKLGISRSGVPLVTAFELDYLRKQTEDFCRLNKIPYVDMRQMRLMGKTSDYSRQNRLMARYLKAILEKTEISVENVNFPTTKGRFERVTIGPINITFVGAHNLEGIRKLAMRIEGLNPFDELYLSFSKRPLDEIKTCLKILDSRKIAKEIFLTSFEHPKAQLSLKDLSGSYLENWKKYLEDCLQKKDKKEILVTGSYYFIGEFQKALFKHRTNSFS